MLKRSKSGVKSSQFFSQKSHFASGYFLFVAVAGFYLILAANNVLGIAVAKSKPAKIQSIKGVYEPSGVVQLDDGRLLVVDDESVNPFVVLKTNLDDLTFEASYLQRKVFFKDAIGRISDLEGVTKDSTGHIYAITSQSRNNNGKRKPEREKLIRFGIEGDRLVEPKVRTDFRDELIYAFPILSDAANERKVKKKQGLNIEGLSLSPDNRLLWVGLRAPLVNNRAILIGLTNPQDAVESGEPFHFAPNPILLDLDGGGIRDITYDSQLLAYLILSHNEDTDDEFKLWQWSGHANDVPQRLLLSKLSKLKRTEGITPLTLQGKNMLLMLNDDGNKQKRKMASYHLIEYNQLSSF